MTKNEAIVSYLKAQSKVHGMGSVILLPEFEGDDTAGWSAVGSGMRPTKKDGTSYIRLGSLSLGDNLKVSARYTNVFVATAELAETLDSLCVVVGGKVPGKLVAHERLEPFRRTNSELDIKWADKNAGIPCLVDDQPIYRRIEHTTNMSKEDVLVAHTNGAAISSHARATWVANNKPNSSSMVDASKKAQRIAELKAIAKTKRTPEQVAELAELLED